MDLSLIHICFISGMTGFVTDIKNLALKELPVYVVIAALLSPVSYTHLFIIMWKYQRQVKDICRQLAFLMKHDSNICLLYTSSSWYSENRDRKRTGSYQTRYSKLP